MRSFYSTAGITGLLGTLLLSPGDSNAGKQQGYQRPYQGSGRAASLVVGVYDNYFAPGVLKVSVGMTVQWQNHSSHLHTVTAPGLWESGKLRPGASFALTFIRPGTYYYFCRVH